MRILYLHQYFTTPQMTGGTRSYEIARRLVNHGHEVHMVTSARDPRPNASRDWTESEEAGIRVHWLPVPYSNHMRYRDRIAAFARFAFAAARKASRLRADVVYATSTPLTIAIPAIRAARVQGVPMVFEVRDLWPEVPIAIGALRNPAAIAAATWLERVAYRNAAHVVALSPGMRDGVVAAGYPASRVTVIPNSCDRDLFDVGPEPGLAIRAQYAWLGDRPMLLYAGTLGLVNGVAYLARLAAEVARADSEIRFVVLGDGREQEMVRRVAASLGVLDVNFFMLPSAPKASMPAWLSAATIATSVCIDVPVVWVNSANKFFDTLAAGRPVAINYNGWQADLLRESGAGLVLDRDPAVAARQLVGAINDADWLQRASDAARHLAADRFDRDRLTDQLEQILLSVVRPSGAPKRGAAHVREPSELSGVR
jgi:glycosyltransferase involved in cell wall biosynthesis